MFTRENFRLNFKRLRQKRGISQKEIARQLCISPQSVSKWEREIDGSYPNIEYLPMLARILSCDIGEFFLILPDDENLLEADVDELIEAIEIFERGEVEKESELSFCQAVMRLSLFENDFYTAFPFDKKYLMQIFDCQNEEKINLFVEKMVHQGVFAPLNEEKHKDSYLFSHMKFNVLCRQYIASAR